MRHAVVVIQRAVWLYRWFTLRLGDAEDLGRARDRHFPQDDSSLGRTVRSSMGKKTKEAAASQPHHCHLDDMFVSMGGRRMYLLHASLLVFRRPS
jgi:transposase-like protein